MTRSQAPTPSSSASLRACAPLLAVLAAASLALACDEEAKKNEMLAKTQGDAAAVAPGAPSASAAPTPAPEAPKKPKECVSGADLVIDDPDLETELRRKLSKLPKAGEKPAPLRASELAAVHSVNLTAKASLDALDPCVFPKLTGLQHLYLGKGKLQDLKPIAGLLQLESLRVAYTEVQDLTPLEKLVKLDRVDLGHAHVRDLAPLSNLVNLTELELDGDDVTDLSPLAKCKKLEKLSIKRTTVTDVSPLKDLTKLKYLYIEGSGVTTFDALAPLVARGLKVVTK
jgi:internalin A